MGIDLVFVIMAAYGFYFGYTTGLIRVVFFIVAILGGLLIAMLLTPPAARLLQATFETESQALPLFSFFLNCLFLFMIGRILFKMTQENVKSQELGQMAQSIGGFLMSAMFIFLFSVLISFFTAAHAIKPEIARQKSLFYPFLEKIPTSGTELMRTSMPFIDQFYEFMKESIKGGEEQEIKKENLKDLEKVYDEEVDDGEEDILDESETEEGN